MDEVEVVGEQAEILETIVEHLLLFTWFEWSLRSHLFVFLFQFQVLLNIILS